MDGSKKSVPKKEDETTIFYWKLEKEKAAGESDKELPAICWVSLLSRLFDKNTLQCLKEKKNNKQNIQRLLRLTQTFCFYENRFTFAPSSARYLEFTFSRISHSKVFETDQSVLTTDEKKNHSCCDLFNTKYILLPNRNILLSAAVSGFFHQVEIT